MDEHSINFLAIGEKSTLDLSELIDKANARNLRIAGGIFPMVIYDDYHLDDGVILKKLATSGNLHLVQNINKLIYKYDLPDLNEKVQSCIVLLDGLMDNVSGFLDCLYEKYWNRIHYVGAGAGSLSLKREDCIFSNEGLFKDAALLILTEKEVSLGVNHGWDKIAGPYIANKTDGKKIIELNWRPAFDVYKEAIEEYTGVHITKENFFTISKGHPFGIYRSGQEDVVRDPLMVQEDGSIICIGHISQNVALNILGGENDKLVESASIAARKSFERLSEPKEIFVVDCISRVLYLGEDFKNELGAVKHQLNGKKREIAVEGVLSLGEISSGKGGYLEFYNKTIVVSAFQ